MSADLHDEIARLYRENDDLRARLAAVLALCSEYAEMYEMPSLEREARNLAAPRGPQDDRYEPADPMEHYAQHHNVGRPFDMEFSDGVITSCTICDPMRAIERARLRAMIDPAK